MKTFMGYCAEVIIDIIESEGYGFCPYGIKTECKGKTCYCLAGAIGHINGKEWGVNNVNNRYQLGINLDKSTLAALINGFDLITKPFHNPLHKEAYEFGVYVRRLAERRGLLYR